MYVGHNHNSVTRALGGRFVAHVILRSRTVAAYKILDIFRPMRRQGKDSAGSDGNHFVLCERSLVVRRPDLYRSTTHFSCVWNVQIDALTT